LKRWSDYAVHLGRASDLHTATASPPLVRSVGAVRTVRRLMAGTAYVRSPFAAP